MPNGQVPPWRPGAPLEEHTLLARLVLEQHPVFEPILQDAGERLRQETGDPSFDAYVSGSPDRVRAQVRAIYEEIRSLGLTYRVEPPGSLPDRQIVRLADELLRQKSGCCIDLVLLLAGALKHVGLLPLIAVVSDAAGLDPPHAVLGYWLVERSIVRNGLPRVVLTWKTLQRHLGEIAFVECTRVAEGPSWPFAEAEAYARTKIPAPPGKPANGQKLWYAVDVQAARRMNIWPHEFGEPLETAPAEPAAPRRSSRQAEAAYRQAVIRARKDIRVLRRARLVDVERVYVTLSLADYVPAQDRPDRGTRRHTHGEMPLGQMPATRALRIDPCRLVIVGEPGSGKTFLLHYLSLAMARRGRPPNAWSWTCPALAEEARALVHEGSAHAIDRASRWMARVRLPGAGAPLRWAVRALDGARDRLTRFPLPYYLTLNDLARSRESIDTHLVSALAEAGFRAPEEALARMLRAGGFLVLLDALDEVVDLRARARVLREVERFVGRHPEVPVVVSCRTATFGGGRVLLNGFSRLEVQEFSDPQIEPFVRHWFAQPSTNRSPRDPDDLLRILNPAPLVPAEGGAPAPRAHRRLSQLARNPLLLSLICFNYECDLRLPDRRVDLYASCADELLLERDRAIGIAGQAASTVDAKRFVLRVIARRFFEQGHVGLGIERQRLLRVLVRVLPLVGVDPSRAAELLDELVERSGLLRRASKTSYAFFHFTFQEFFAAEWFHLRGRSPLGHVADPRWREVILLYVALATNPVERLRQVRAHDVVFAALALADSVEHQSAAFEALAREIVADLSRLVEHEPDRRQEAADALAELGRWRATERLVGFAQDGLAGSAGAPAEVALAAVLALARGDREACERLAERLGPMLRLLAGHLGKISDGTDVRILALLDRLGCPMVPVPAGEFTMGSEEEGNETPVHRVTLPLYWMGRYAVTNRLYRRFCNETRYPNRGSADEPEQTEHPVTYVSWRDGVACARWAGMALPSEAEWEKAARGTDGRRYPWGDQWDANNSGTGGTSPVGSYPGNVSPHGCYDMAGNVREWTRSGYEPYPYEPTDGRESMKELAEGSRVVRGGAFNNGDFARAACRNWYDPDLRHHLVGFRLVVSPFTSGL